MERKWLEAFYKECGREVSLAYEVLNYSNNWGVTLVAAVLATGFLSTVRIQDNRVIIQYPTIIHWYYLVFAWIVMIRFFVRSALGLGNMYRWNVLIYASSKILSLPENHPYQPIFINNFAKKIDAYYYKWKSPIKKQKLIWQNLKLMYFWFFLVILALFIWGLIRLDKNSLYWVGVGTFLIPFIIEAIWFYKWPGFKYEKLELEEEPNTSIFWRTSSSPTEEIPELLIMGFCEDGPYKNATSLLESKTVEWIPWNYHTKEIDSFVFNKLCFNYNFYNQKVAFASWGKSYKGPVPILRYGRIDHSKFINGFFRITVHLDEYDENCKNVKIEVKNPKIYCFFEGEIKK
jgi:hypothetical protein